MVKFKITKKIITTVAAVVAELAHASSSFPGPFLQQPNVIKMCDYPNPDLFPENIWYQGIIQKTIQNFGAKYRNTVLQDPSFQ